MSDNSLSCSKNKRPPLFLSYTGRFSFNAQRNLITYKSIKAVAYKEQLQRLFAIAQEKHTITNIVGLAPFKEMRKYKLYQIDEKGIDFFIVGENRNILDLSTSRLDSFFKKKASSSLLRTLPQELSSILKFKIQTQIKKLEDMLLQATKRLDTILTDQSKGAAFVEEEVIATCRKLHADYGFYPAIYYNIKPETRQARVLFKIDPTTKEEIVNMEINLPPEGASFYSIKDVTSSLRKFESFIMDLRDPKTFIDHGFPFNAEKAAADIKRGITFLTIFRGVLSGERPIVMSIHADKESCFADAAEEKRAAESIKNYLIQISLAFKKIKKEEEALNKGVNTVKITNATPPTEDQKSETFLPLSREQKLDILKQGRLFVFRGHRIRIIEYPLKAFYKKIPAVVDWFREVVIDIYKNTEEMKDKSREEMISLLSLDDASIIKRVIEPRYLILPEGDPSHEEDIKGVISCSVMDNLEGVGVVLEIPQVMLKSELRGGKMQLAIIRNIFNAIYKRDWADRGFFKGFWYMLIHGMPLDAATQSLRVIRDFLMAKDVSILRVIRGQELTYEQKLIINAASKGKADSRGMEYNAYKGRIALVEEEENIVLRKPILRFLLKKRRQQEDAKIKQLVKEAIENNGRIHLVGNGTIGANLKTVWDLFWIKIFRR